MTVESKNVLQARAFSDEKMKKINLFETANLFCDVYCLQPGQRQKVHAHEVEDKIYYVLEGEGTFFIGDDAQKLSAGHMVLAARGQLHGVTNESDKPLSILVFMTPNPNFR